MVWPRLVFATCTQLADSSQVRKDPVAAQGDFGYNVEDNFSNVSSRRL